MPRWTSVKAKETVQATEDSTVIELLRFFGLGSVPSASDDCVVVGWGEDTNIKKCDTSRFMRVILAQGPC